MFNCFVKKGNLIFMYLLVDSIPCSTGFLNITPYFFCLQVTLFESADTFKFSMFFLFQLA